MRSTGQGRASSAMHAPLSPELLRLCQLFGISSVLVDRFADHLVGHFGQIFGQRRVDLLELWPEYLVEETLRRPHHDTLPAHAGVAVRAQTIAAAQRDEHLP